jgi:predicted MPP superfamily phosphohydrolase
LSLPVLFVVTRFIWPLHLPLSVKVVLALLLLVASQYHFWSRLSSGSMFSPEFPRFVIILFNWAFGAIILLALMQLALDAATLLAMLVHGGPVSVPDGVRYAIGVIAGALAAIGVHQAIRVPPVKEIEIAIAGLAPPFDGYTMLQLTDLHISRLFPGPWARAMVERANGLGADLIVVTGDLIDGALASRRADVEPLRDLRAQDGVYMIPGNHEYFFGYRAWMDHFAAMGMRVLENVHAVLDRDGGRLVLAGVTDLSAAHTGNPAHDLAGALKGAPAGVPVILLDHQPRDARAAAALGVALQLSGHTHGGMVVGLDRLAARANNGYVSGRYRVDRMILYVNNGTGLWPGFALRLGRPSELTRITLRRTAD